MRVSCRASSGLSAAQPARPRRQPCEPSTTELTRSRHRAAIRTNIVQRRGRSHGRGIPDVALWPISRSTPARRQRTAPDEISELRLKPAYQSLITDVFRLRLHRCTIIPPRTPAKIAGRRYLALKRLDDIREFLVWHSLLLNACSRLMLGRLVSLFSRASEFAKPRAQCAARMRRHVLSSSPAQAGDPVVQRQQ